MEDIKKLRSMSYQPKILLASFTANFLGMALPLVMIQIYDRIIPNNGYGTLIVLTAGVVSAIVAEAAVRLARDALLSGAGAQFEAAIYDKALQSLVNSQNGKLLDVSSGDLLTRLSSIDKIRSHYCSASAASLLDIPFVGIFLLMMFAISPELSAIAACFVVVVFFVVGHMRRKTHGLVVDREISDSRRQSFIVETLFGIEFIKSVGVENLMERRYERLLSGSAPLGAQIGAHTQLTQGMIAMIGLLAPFLTTVVGAYLVIAGEMSVGGLAASVLLTGRAIQPVLRIEAYWGGREAIRKAEADLRELARTEEVEKIDQFDLASLETVELCDVTWAPHPDRPAVLSKVSLTLRRGDCVSISGDEGAGKSSLLSLLSGNVRPTSGELLLNGLPSAAYSLDDKSRVICTLSRENSLLDGSLMENLTGFKGTENLPRALELATQIGIDSFIERHSSGLDMRVYSGGKSGLPNAIADSVVIVGGLSSEPDLILFDSANSRLDSRQDRMLLEVLSQLQPTSIIVLITHRPSYLHLAKYHLSLKAGVLSVAANQYPLDLGRYAEKCA